MRREGCGVGAGAERRTRRGEENGDSRRIKVTRRSLEGQKESRATRYGERCSYK